MPCLPSWQNVKWLSICIACQKGKRGCVYTLALLAKKKKTNFLLVVFQQKISLVSL
jgi:hypothetical protein